MAGIAVEIRTEHLPNTSSAILHHDETGETAASRKQDTQNIHRNTCQKMNTSENWLSWLKFFVVFLSLSRQIPRQYVD
jgi:hypothetical protein